MLNDDDDIILRTSAYVHWKCHVMFDIVKLRYYFRWQAKEKFHVTRMVALEEKILNRSLSSHKFFNNK